MESDFERKAEKNGLALKIYRGEGMALLAFDLAREKATPDFVGFAVEVRPPGQDRWFPLRNRLRFDNAPPDANTRFSSFDAPFQKYRWTHVPAEIQDGDYGYRVTAMHMRPDGSLVAGEQVAETISLAPTTIGDFINVGFTRAFASSQAYNEKPWPNKEGIIPPPELKGKAELDHPTEQFQKHYEWLGFEARRLIFDMLDRAIADDDVTVDAMIYECREPDVLKRFEQLGGRLRALIDDHGEYGDADSPETISAERLKAAGAEVHRTHFGRQQHNKVLIIRRKGKAEEVLAGSTNFSLRGLYIQANNALLFKNAEVAALFGRVFDAYWDKPGQFRKNPLAETWHVLRNEPDSRFSFCFSPHADNLLSLDPIARAIEEAESSVLYAVVFLPQLTGRVRDGLEDLVNRSLFSYGVAQRTGGLTVRKPDGSRGLLPFAYIGSNAPEPFKSEWSGGDGNMVHHKFVVTDFNGKSPKVFTGSSNLSAGGEKSNGDHIVFIEDRKVAIAYAIEALRLFDHFHFRVRLREGEIDTDRLTLARPPASPDGKTWFERYYRPGHIKERDRKLFAG
ncbi:phospholipase D-like domain-containing protein [Rhizobium puerariae]|uniref:Phospholipase D n=1 Tax=Rhizobium puerariae TaxID=1585791 RepID=A0ABV6ALF1_9HYPH